MSNIKDLLDKCQYATERLLIRRQLRKCKRGQRPKTLKNEALDWIGSLLYAVVVIYLLSLYLFQLFVVPTGSMENTINPRERVGVSKRMYGTELYSFGPKTSKKMANKDDIVVFYHPEYKSKGAFKENLYNALFLITFSLYNPSKEEKLLVKRAIGMPGDTVRFDRGDVYIKKFAHRYYEPENPKTYVPLRTVSPKEEDQSVIRGAMSAYSVCPENLPAYLYSYNLESDDKLDYYTCLSSYTRYSTHIEPYNTVNLSDSHMYENGLYVGERCILPLGDNRDNSADGRYFGPVSMKTVIGRVAFRFWPLGRFKLL